jgi:hypothetical protein
MEDKPIACAAGSPWIKKLFVDPPLAASESVCKTAFLAVALTTGRLADPVAVSTVLILGLTPPSIAWLALIESTGLVAFLPIDVSTLAKTAVSLLAEAVSKASPVIAIVEPVVKGRRDAEWLLIPGSGNPGIPPVVRRPITIDPIIVGSWTGRDVVRIGRRRQVGPIALSTEAYADWESGLGKQRSSNQKHYREQFRFHKFPSFTLSNYMAMAER